MVHTNNEFIADPTGHMIAVIDIRERAEQAESTLEAERFEEVRLYRGGEGARALDSDGERHGLGSYLLRLVQHGFTNKDHLGEYEEATRQGASVVSFLVDSADGRRERAEAILAEADARTINYFGPAVVETIKP
jgi:hypothetical protein